VESGERFGFFLKHSQSDFCHLRWILPISYLPF
jgi:hypothetical protein